MPSVRIHCAISQKRTGFGFEDLHRWIDNGAKTMGIDHRRKRHHFNLEDQKHIRDFWDATKGPGWGEKAVVEWLFHIALDNLETAYKCSLRDSSYGPNTYNRMEITLNRNGYIDCEFDRVPATPCQSGPPQIRRYVP
jgi:hypothetical protein